MSVQYISKDFCPIEIFKSFFFNLRDNITSSSRIEDESIEAFKDYEYDYDNTTTAIYTRDDWKY